MKPWNERPFEIRNLFNPAFCAVVLLRAFCGYEEKDQTGIPFSLSLLILPLCLHSDTRRVIMDNKLTYFIKVIERNPHVLVGLGERTHNLLPYTLEGLGFAMQSQAFTVTNDGHLKTNDKCIQKSINGTSEMKECQRAARLIGKGFGIIGDRVTIYTTLGIKP